MKFVVGPTADVRALDGLLPHLQRALQLRECLAAAELKAGAGLAALDALAFGAVACEADGRDVHANLAAEAAPGEGLVLGPAGIGALRADDSHGLTDLVANAAGSGPGGALSITGPDGRTLLALVAPLPPGLGNGRRLAPVTMRPAALSAR